MAGDGNRTILKVSGFCEAMSCLHFERRLGRRGSAGCGDTSLKAGLLCCIGRFSSPNSSARRTHSLSRFWHLAAQVNGLRKERRSCGTSCFSPRITRINAKKKRARKIWASRVIRGSGAAVGHPPNTHHGGQAAKWRQKQMTKHPPSFNYSECVRERGRTLRSTDHQSPLTFLIGVFRGKPTRIVIRDRWYENNDGVLARESPATAGRERINAKKVSRKNLKDSRSLAWFAGNSCPLEMLRTVPLTRSVAWLRCEC